jgi:aspartyl-tRNA(Asn)/glutamyl-tRNA(Gln) amidotransferase subunit A
MNTIAFASIQELRTLLDAKKISASELLKLFLERAHKYNPELNAALEIFEHESIMSDYIAGEILDGIPGLIKDNIAQKGRKLTCASAILENFTAPEDATATALLKKAGALLLGRANMDEFAMGSSNETSAFGPVRNPWDPTRVPGGSSGGSIAAVAAGLVPWALGSETGGSVRQPAAFCGIVGYKPTYGLISRNGLVAYASSLDHIGIATRTVADTAHVLTAINGKDVRDSSSKQIDPIDFTKHLDGKVPSGIKIGVVQNTLQADGMDPQVTNAISHALGDLEKLGAHIVPVTLPILDYSAALYFIISRAEAASNLGRFDGIRYGLRSSDAHTLAQVYGKTRNSGFGTEVKTRILVGNYVLSAGHAAAFYEKACAVQQLMRAEFESLFKKVDLLVMPTHPAPAFKFGAFDVDKLQMDLQDYFTCFANLTGIPAISVPCGFSSENLPIGFQLVGPWLGDEQLLKVAHAYQNATDWHKRTPAGY